ncbi:unnamed protein product [Arabis nemorensis]|uniref:No apical meristem-associated C-terminal domain-containing protein n=1 Tax=Arabis nemorensis TaxID=586526 RepID=A0A565AYB2_9BRAS|nr:unnamed protein product [Arabis nemorensis]
MDMNFTNPNFTDLLNSQQEIIFPKTFSQQQSPLTDHSRLNKDTGYSSTSNTACHVEEELEERPLGVKASKVKEKKRGKGESEETEESSLKVLQEMWLIKEKDNIVRERLSKKKILEGLILKSEPLSQGELTLKNKLVAEMCDGEDLTEEEV